MGVAVVVGMGVGVGTGVGVPVGGRVAGEANADSPGEVGVPGPDSPHAASTIHVTSRASMTGTARGADRRQCDDLGPGLNLSTVRVIRVALPGRSPTSPSRRRCGRVSAHRYGFRRC